MDAIWKFKWFLKRTITYLDMNIIYATYPLSTPLYINIEPTSCCNLNCVMCPLDNSRKKGFMDLELYKKIINQASKMKIGTVRLFLAGEPLLYKEIDKMISYAHKRIMKVEIHTNGTLLTPQMTDKLLLDPLDYLSFSIDGRNAKEYNKMRINGDFNVTMKNVIYFLKEKRRRKLKKPFVIIQNMIWYKLNTTEDKSESIIKYFKNLPINKYKQMHPYVWGEEVKKSQDVSKFRPRGRYKIRCNAPWDHISILWDGRVVTCCEDLNGKQIIGDIKKESLKKIWHGKRVIMLRKAIKNRNFSNWKLCRTCHRLWSNNIYDKYPSFIKLPLKYYKHIISNLKKIKVKKNES